MQKSLVKFSDLIREAKKSSSDDRLADELIFTPRAELTLELAVKEAYRLHHNLLSTAHLFLGLIELGQGVAFSIVQKMNLDIEVIRKEAEKEAPSGPNEVLGTSDTVPIRCSPRIISVAVLAQEEAKNLGHGYVGVEHLLLGLLKEEGSVDGCLLRRFSVDVVKIRQEILQEIQPNFGAT